MFLILIHIFSNSHLTPTPITHFEFKNDCLCLCFLSEGFHAQMLASVVFGKISHQVWVSPSMKDTF